MMAKARWETRRQDDRIATNADQTEFTAIQYGSANVEAGTYDDRVAGALDDYEASSSMAGTEWAEYDIALDNAASDIGTELQRRRNILGNAYPFRIVGNRVIYEGSSTLVYEFCLAVSSANSLNQGEYAKLPIAFERLARDVLVSFLGPGTQAMRTGWPSDAFEKRPNRFKQVVELLCNQTSEWQWCPDRDKPEDPDPQHVKDEGLDFVVWKEVPDGRPGKLFLLGQCACGNDYGTKFNDIDPALTKLSGWIKPICYAPPVRVFATPRHIPNDSYFQDVNKQAGLTLDRIRIALIAEAEYASDQIPNKAVISYEDLIKIVVSHFQAAPSTPSQQPETTAVEQHSQLHENEA